MPEREARIAEAQGIIRARLNFQGTTMGFSTERTDALWWLMISSDSNAVRALLTLLDRPTWRDDVPRLVRGAIGRQQSGHWNTTVANAWGMLAMEKFSAAFEATPVTGETPRDVRPPRRSRWRGARTAASLTEQLPWQDTPPNARRNATRAPVGRGHRARERGIAAESTARRADSRSSAPCTPSSSKPPARWTPRRRRSCAPRRRRAIRHDLGRRRRSDPGRRNGPRQRSRRPVDKR